MNIAAFLVNGGYKASNLKMHNFLLKNMFKEPLNQLLEAIALNSPQKLPNEITWEMVCQLIQYPLDLKIIFDEEFNIRLKKNLETFIQDLSALMSAA